MREVTDEWNADSAEDLLLIVICIYTHIRQSAGGAPRGVSGFFARLRSANKGQNIARPTLNYNLT